MKTVIAAGLGGVAALAIAMPAGAAASASTPSAIGTPAPTSTPVWTSAFTAFGPLSLPIESLERPALMQARAAVASHAADPSSGDAYCYGTPPPVVAHDLIVPPTDPSGNPNICVAIGTQVGHDVVVEPAPTSDAGMYALLSDDMQVGHDVVVGANGTAGLIAGSVGHDLSGEDPFAVEVVGDGTTTPVTRAVIGHSILVDGSNQGVVSCGTNVGQDVVLDDDAGMIIGDQDDGCAGDGGGLLVGHDFVADDNNGGYTTDISDNTPAYGGGIGHDFTALNDTSIVSPSGPIVENNAIAHDALCNPPATTDGPDAPNQVGHSDNGCNAWVGQSPPAP